jgi:glutamate-ammonia-ligase adenylyltransferase
MKPDSAARLAEAYTFLRRVEHRIQYLDDQQTHLLPTQDSDLDWIARSLGLEPVSAACPLLDRLGELREFVATEFDALLHDGRSSVGGAKPGGGCRTCGPVAHPIDSEAFLEQLPPELAARVRRSPSSRGFASCATTASCAWRAW